MPIFEYKNHEHKDFREALSEINYEPEWNIT